jgi:hypothetical protein
MALVVTGLYDLQSKENNKERRPVSDYTKYVDFLLRIERDIVVFTEESLKPELEPLFTNHSNIKLLVLPFEEFEYINQVDVLKANALKNPFKTDSPYKTTVHYTLLMWNKFFLVQKAYTIFPTYDKYVWMDFGLGYVVEKNPCDVNLVLDNFDADHFSCTIINPMNRQEFESLDESFGAWKYRQVGGFWSIGKNCIDFFMQFIRDQINFIIAAERICADEEIMARFSFSHPDKCVFSFGDYASCVCNWVALTHDLTVASNAINKSNNCGLHHMASQGAYKVLDSFNRNLLHIDKYTVIHFMFMYYIQMYYIDKSIARQIAIQYLLSTHVDSDFSKLFEERRESLKQQFLFVMSEQEFDDWCPPRKPYQVGYETFTRLLKK